MRIFSLLLVFTLTACSSTGVVPTGDDTYMIAKRSAQAGFGPPVKTRAAVYAEANEFCAKKQASVETINLDVINSGFGRPGSVTLEFRCE